MDDYLKMKHKNSKGLPAKKKFALQLLFAVLLGVYLLWPSMSQAIHYGNWFTPPAVNYGDYFFPFKKGALFTLGGIRVDFSLYHHSGGCNRVFKCGEFNGWLDGLASGCIIFSCRRACDLCISIEQQ